ncbi:mitochondrial pyruvate carrier [Citrus sinensis]|nr:mitochondrial pyruvate carrier [Citrus sinensis]
MTLMLEFTIPQNLCTIVSSHWPHHHGEGTKRKEKEKKGKKKKEIDLMAANKLVALWNHPAGPKTKELIILAVHFWAPTFKWGISIANIADFSKPPEKISYPQQLAVTATGVIWSRYSMVITPKNWNLFSVNVAMAGTGLYQLSRKIKAGKRQKSEPLSRQDYFSESTEIEAAAVQE